MFDPLHKWLGIPPNEQPPDDYRLLGVARFESDLDVIDVAADRHLSFLHDMTNGEHGDLAESLSNRISAARLKLLNTDKKAAYDLQLRSDQSQHDDIDFNDDAIDFNDDAIDVDSVLTSLETFHDTPGSLPPVPAPIAKTPPPTAQLNPPPLTNSAAPVHGPAPVASQPALSQPALSQPGPQIAEKRKGARKPRRRASLLWMASIIPGLVVLSVLVFMIATNRLRFDQQKLENLGVSKEQASKLAGPPQIVEVTIGEAATSSNGETSSNQMATSSDDSPRVPDRTLSKRQIAAATSNQSMPNAPNGAAPRVTTSNTAPSTPTQRTSTQLLPSQPATSQPPSTPLVPIRNVADARSSLKTGPLRTGPLDAGRGRPLPSPLELDEKRGTVRELYRTKYQNAKTQTDKLAIANDMTIAAKQTLDDPVGQYALYDAARRIFLAEGDFASAIVTVQRVHDSFPQLNHIQLKKEILDKAPPAAKRTDEYARASMQLANECLNEGKADIGLDAVLIAKKSLRRPTKQTVTLLKQLQQELANAQQLFDDYEKQALVLEQTPDNPAARSAVAKYLCLVENKWQLELPRMASGSDEAYKAAAQSELDYRDGKINALQLGDAWFSVFEQATFPLEKRRLADRSKNFYLTARNASSGIDILKIDQRVASLQPFATPGSLASVVPGSALGTYDPNAPVKPKSFPGPPRLIQSQTYDHPGYAADYASIRGKALRVGMGSTPGGFGHAAAGVELENVASIRVTGAASAPPARRNSRTLIGFFIDYQTFRGFSHRVCLSIEGDPNATTSSAPPWGTASRPTSNHHLGTQNQYILDLHQWAPEDWNGKSWFSVVMRDAGENRMLSAILSW